MSIFASASVKNRRPNAHISDNVLWALNNVTNAEARHVLQYTIKGYESSLRGMETRLSDMEASEFKLLAQEIKYMNEIHDLKRRVGQLPELNEQLIKLKRKVKELNTENESWRLQAELLKDAETL